MVENILEELEKGNILQAIKLLPIEKRVIALGLYGEYEKSALTDNKDKAILYRCLQDIQVQVNRIKHHQ